MSFNFVNYFKSQFFPEVFLDINKKLLLQDYAIHKCF